MEEAEASDFLLELAPRAYPYASGVPSYLWLVRGLVEPEVAMVEQREVVFLVEQGGIFASLLAVVAPHADEVVVVEPGPEVAQLADEHLLGSEHVRSLEVDHVANHLAACCPHVALLLIAVVAIADVVSADEDGLRAHGHGEEQAHG